MPLHITSVAQEDNGDLVVRAGSQRRVIALPAGIAALELRGARMEADVLRVDFRSGASADGANPSRSERDASILDVDVRGEI